MSCTWISKTNGGVPPFGHTTQLRVFIDPDLLQWPEVWAAAGTWNDVFGIEPHTLVEASGGAITDLKRGRFSWTYTDPMETTPTLEDWRGVDVEQIRRQLRMTPKERVRDMVRAANLLMSIREHAAAARRRQSE